MASTVLSPELDYKPQSYKHGSKVLTQIYQQTGGQTVTIPPTATQDSIFEIPIKAITLADSFLRGIATPTAGGAGNYNWAQESVHLISEIHLYTRGGQYLCQLFNAANYDAMTTPWNTQLDSFMTADSLDRFYPSRALGTTTDIGGRAVGAFPSSAPYTEQQYMKPGTANAATPVIPFNIRLGRYRNTILALKKAFLFPDVILLRVVWGPGQKVMSMSTSATDPTAGAAIPAGNITISNLSLFLSVETDPAIISDLTALVSTGYQMPIPFVYVNRQSTTASTSQAITVKVTPDMGFAVKQLIYAPFNSTENVNTALDHDNRNGAKLLTYMTQLDSVNRQQYTLNCQTNYWDDWTLHRKLMTKTVIQDRDIYQYNWVHVEDFSDLSIGLDINQDNMFSGIPIMGPQGSERIWTMSGTSANAAFAHYTFIVAYKTLIVGPGSIIVVAAPPA
jgi:hypothetical protein